MAIRFSPPEEIRQVLTLSEKQFRKAIRARFKVPLEMWLESCAAKGRYIVRQKMFDRATEGEGHPVLLKWLGIQHLGQRERVDVLHKAAPGQLADDSAEKAQAEREKGFAVLVPNGTAMVLDALPGAQAHDEVPEVEAIIVEEVKNATDPKPSAKQGEIIVEAFPVEE